ncbi:MAG: YihY/virulence factor BrkB family protein [Clostridia bacterium]|nr:YihY/virulence factor BrkB family protein [Clostridia bacterium]
MEAVLRFFKNIFTRIDNHKITVYAAQATLFIVISVLPFTMLLISIIKYIIPFGKSDIAAFASPFFPDSFMPMLNTVLDEIFSGATVSIVSVTTVATVWSASKGMMSLVQGLESVYETGDRRGYIKTRLYAYVYTLFFVVIIAATLMFSVAGKYFLNLAVSHLPALSPVADFIGESPVVIYLIILTVVFGLLYKILPGRGFTFINQLPGAFFSALGWVCFSAGYSFYVNRFANYSYIYGSLTAVVLLILWLYFCMNIFLLGAELNCFLKERKEKPIEG